ncbi:MAG: translation elongation factor Ts [Candidatus Spechtbacterales bacterium]|nr:translation elongation factor Ts [Candidatus Spechtbacterales bacterium]
MANTEQIQKLRSETGAGMLDVKNALDEAGGDLEKAREILRKKGAALAAKKSARETHEGLVVSYIHAGGKIGVLLKIYCETDFVARTDDFQSLADNIAMHIAAMDPEYISPEDIPSEVIEAEKKIYKGQFADSGKPENVIEDIVEGKIKKFGAENSLLEQPFVKDQDKTIAKLIEEHVAKLGENIQVGEFTRYEL